MTKIALLALTFTLAAVVAAEPAQASDAPAEDAPAATDAGPAPTPIAAKPAESDIEVLSEVVDLEESDDPTVDWYGSSYPPAVRILALSTARALTAGGWEMVIDHRSTSPIYDSSSSHAFEDMGKSFFGLDSPIRVGLGFRYGVIDDLDIGAYRGGSSRTDTYELDVRYQILHQSGLGLDLAARYGVTWFMQPNAADATGFYGQLLATRLLFNRVLLSAGAMYHSNSTNDTKYNQDKAWSVAFAGGVEVRAAAGLAFDAELASCTAGYCSKNPTFSGGVKYITNRHTFALVCGNTTYLTADGYITNTDRPWSKLTIGFQITRTH
jgi:hypothetical protein